jgi:hypothetical protein
MDREEYSRPSAPKKIKRVRQIPGATRQAKIARMQRHLRAAPNDVEAARELSRTLR